MRRHSFLPAVLLAMWLVPAAAGAQSLADVARAEEARRKAIKSTGKVYTNDDLNKGAVTSTAPPAPASPAATTSPTTPAKPDPEKPQATSEEPRKDEKYWKGRMTALRNDLSRNKVLAEALQSRVNALTTDFMNRDDPAQRSVIEQDRRAALAEMDRVKLDIEKASKAITDLEEEARKGSVPPGWLR